MRHGSLFSGIGGFDLAAEWMGWENIFQVEKDSFCQKVLEKNFPNTKRYGDIKEFDGTKYRGAVDIISGGFPCQPFSVAGKRKGKEDDRFLWPEMLRVISEVRPSFIVGENVTGIIGMALEQVLTEVEAQGYYTETFIIPACGVNAPHRRDRVWIIAVNTERKSNGGHNAGKSERVKLDMERIQLVKAGWNKSSNHSKPSSLNVAHTNIGGRIQNNEEQRSGQFEQNIPGWGEFPTQPPLRTGNDGLPSRLVRSSIHAAGNAIVPQVAYEIFKAIDLIS